MYLSLASNPFYHRYWADFKLGIFITSQPFPLFLLRTATPSPASPPLPSPRHRYRPTPSAYANANDRLPSLLFFFLPSWNLTEDDQQVLITLDTAITLTLSRDLLSRFTWNEEERKKEKEKKERNKKREKTREKGREKKKRKSVASRAISSPVSGDLGRVILFSFFICFSFFSVSL